MNIIFNPQKLLLSDRFKQRIQTKFDQGLGKLLKNYQEDLKVASLAIEKVTCYNEIRTWFQQNY